MKIVFLVYLTPEKKEKKKNSVITVDYDAQKITET